jgi:hypothetical protein
MSALADRIKIANGKHSHSPDVNLAIQFILNCGADVAGSCHGGSHSGRGWHFSHYFVVKSEGQTGATAPSLDTSCTNRTANNTS